MMGLEAAAAALVGVLALAWVLEPLVRPAAVRPPDDEPPEPEETARGVALAALKEIEFDRETGKLSDADYEALKARYTANALAVLRTESRADDDGIERMVGARTRGRLPALHRLRAPTGARCRLLLVLRVAGRGLSREVRRAPVGWCRVGWRPQPGSSCGVPAPAGVPPQASTGRLP